MWACTSTLQEVPHAPFRRERSSRRCSYGEHGATVRLSTRNERGGTTIDQSLEFSLSPTNRVGFPLRSCMSFLHFSWRSSLSSRSAFSFQQRLYSRWTSY